MFPHSCGLCRYLCVHASTVRRRCVCVCRLNYNIAEQAGKCFDLRTGQELAKKKTELPRLFTVDLLYSRKGPLIRLASCMSFGMIVTLHICKHEKDDIGHVYKVICMLSRADLGKKY